MKGDQMMRRLESRSATLLSVLCLMLSPTLPALAQEAESGPEIVEEDYHDISPPIRELAPVAPLGSSQHVVIPLRRRPSPPIVSPEPDAVTQDVPQGPLVGTTNKLNFNGISDRDGVAPPDTNASVGSTQVVETVNISLKVFNKSTGASVLGPIEISSIFSGVSGACGSGPFYSDPVVLYDK